MIALDCLVFCTGFAPALDHLNDLPVKKDGNKPPTEGVGRSARQTVQEVEHYLTGK